MLGRCMIVAVAAVSIGLSLESAAHAGRFRSGAADQCSAVRQNISPRYRQVDGKSLWDLGMQNGRWPKR
ncbi:MAG: hypothetical protein ACYC6Y_09645 [Thermoguttaceae bacterium]